MTDWAKPSLIGIGEMSRQTGVGIETIRYFEKIGMMPAPGRSEGGNRRYTNVHLQRLFFINRCRQIGFAKDVTCAEVHSITVEHISDIKQKIRDLRKLEKVLTQMANECSRGDIPECPIIETLFAAQG